MLTSKQCDAFMRDQLKISVGCYHDSYSQKDGKAIIRWQVITEYQQYGYSESREQAITAYRDKYHPDWTPSKIHDAEDEWSIEKAILYMGNHHLDVRLNSNDFWVVSHRKTGYVKSSVFMWAIYNWKLKNDPDKPVEDAESRSKPTREGKAVALLIAVLKSRAVITYQYAPDDAQKLLDKIDTFLKEAVEDTDDEGGSDRAE